MDAPVASGTLAGSTSGSSASNRKEAARSDFSRLRRHPRVVRLAQLRPSRSRTSSSGTIAATARSSSSSSTSPAVRDSSVTEARRRESAVVCQQPPVVRSPQFGDRRRSRPRGSRDYRNRGGAITPIGARARALAVESDHPATRGAVIAFVTERSCRRRAWLLHGRLQNFDRRRRRAGADVCFESWVLAAAWIGASDGAPAARATQLVRHDARAC